MPFFHESWSGRAPSGMFSCLIYLRLFGGPRCQTTGGSENYFTNFIFFSCKVILPPVTTATLRVFHVHVISLLIDAVSRNAECVFLNSFTPFIWELDFSAYSSPSSKLVALAWSAQ